MATTMQYRRLGRTNFDVSEIVFGGGYVGGLLILKDDEVRLSVLRTALTAGINWFDTAPMYGGGKSEEALGQLLPAVEWHGPPPRVSTKVFIDLSQTRYDIASQVERSVEQSLFRLRRERVDLLQLHNPVVSGHRAGCLNVEQVLGHRGAVEGLERARATGLTRHIGMTALGEASALKTVISSARLDTAQVYYNLLNPSAAHSMPAAWSGHDFDGIIGACEAEDMGIMGIRAFASGVLATDERHGREAVLTHQSELADETRRARHVLERVAGAAANRAQAAVRFALSNRSLSCVVVGLGEPEHLDDTLAAQAAGPLPQTALDATRESYETWPRDSASILP